MSAMTTAELRGYQQICGDDGAMMVIACDQRGGMRSLLADAPEDQAKITNDILGLTKMDIAAYLARHATAVLVDPICAVPGIVDQGVLHRSTALLIGLDASGWDHESAPPELAPEVVAGTRDRYVEAFRRLTGREPRL